MAERRTTINDQTGKTVNGVLLDVTESTERFSEVLLEDGTSLKTKMTVIQAVRVDDSWDDENNPIYVLKSQHVVMVSHAPDELKRVTQ